MKIGKWLSRLFRVPDNRDHGLTEAEICSDLGFSLQQLGTIGALKRMADSSAILENYRIKYGTTHVHGRPIIYIGEPQQLLMSFQLKSSLKKATHEELNKNIIQDLEAFNLKPDLLFSYCSKSWGYQQDNIDCHWGFDNLRGID